MSPAKQNSLSIVTDSFRAGMRLGVAVSGGADSVALLRRMAELAPELGLVLTVLHVHHGIRGAEADADAVFVQQLAEGLGLRFLRHDVDTISRSKAQRETVEESARKLRYAWFEDLLARRELDAVATAHTLDDQAETVLQKLLRGAWTEGLAGIFPVVELPGGLVLRPFLGTRRSEIESWLNEIGQVWCEDSTNADAAYTRNRIRQHLIPILAEYNPQIVSQLGHVARIARDEDVYWQKELERILPSLLLPGKAVRGGGRASSTRPDEASVGMEVEKLRALSPAIRRRVLRGAAEQVGSPLNFDQTELLMAMCAKAGTREMLTSRVRAERTPRELRLVREAPQPVAETPSEYDVPIPGEVTATSFGFRLIASTNGDSEPPSVKHLGKLRCHKAGDRVRLRYTSGLKRTKEVLERLNVSSEQRKTWPVLEWKGEIVWFRDAEVESDAGNEAGLRIAVEDLP